MPDRRGATFEIPHWVTLPDCLGPHLAARNAATVDELPYAIKGALHFSNAGRVYLGSDRRTGEQVVLKEARPYAGLSADRSDAVTRLRRERDVLERLAGLDVCLDPSGGWLEGHRLDLLGGLAGIGLNLDYFAAATGDASLSDAALLDLAAIALRQDLRRCVPAGDGALHVDEGWRTMPYLADGSVGIGMVLDEYRARRPDERFARAAAAIRRAAHAPFYAQSGLFYGRAGMLLHLGRARPSGTAGPDPVVAAQVRRLAWHALAYRGHLAFPGDRLLRLSMDLSTGAAGVLLALGAAYNGTPAHLPFLGPLGASRVAGARDHPPTAERR